MNATDLATITGILSSETAYPALLACSSAVGQLVTGSKRNSALVLGSQLPNVLASVMISNREEYRVVQNGANVYKNLLLSLPEDTKAMLRGSPVILTALRLVAGPTVWAPSWWTLAQADANTILAALGAGLV